MAATLAQPQQSPCYQRAIHPTTTWANSINELPPLITPYQTHFMGSTCIHSHIHVQFINGVTFVPTDCQTTKKVVYTLCITDYFLWILKNDSHKEPPGLVHTAATHVQLRGTNYHLLDPSCNKYCNLIGPN